MRAGGVAVLGLWARRAEQARAAAATSGVAGFSGALPEVVREARVIVVAVRDESIAEVARMLLDTGLVGATHVLVHCSGAVSAEQAFASVHNEVAGVATLHPLRAIADGGAAIRELSGTVFGVEGDEVGTREVLALAAAVGARPLLLDEEQMAAYHAAASMASNFLVALMDAAAEVLSGGGVESEAALAALLPLAAGSLANVVQKGPEAGLTGPIRRGDYETVARHLAALPAHLLPMYRALGLRTVQIARRLGGEPGPLDRIAALLGSPANSDAEPGG